MKIGLGLSLTGMQRRRDTPFSVIASGGTEAVIAQGGKFYRVHAFLSDGALTVTQGGDVEYLVVGGGGPGGSGFNSGGGGGAGDVLIGEFAVAPGVKSVVVGIGGIAPQTEGDTPTIATASEFLSIAALGGGSGAGATSTLASNRYPAQKGGGGSSTANTSGALNLVSGFSGGSGQPGSTGGENSGGGGAGAGGDGQNAVAPNAGSGGSAVSIAISGDLVSYGRGGGGGSRTDSAGGDPNGAAGNDPANPGVNPGDGGGGAAAGFSIRQGGSGANGIVIVRYEISQAEYEAEAA